MDVVDLIGKKFSYLTVIKYVGKTGWYTCKKYGSKKGYHTWECKCKCGKILNVRSVKLREGSTKSCGCKKKNNKPIWTLPKGEAAKNLLLSIYKESAKKRNLSFTLSKDYFIKITSLNCYYCNDAPSKSVCLRQKGKSKGRSLNGDYLYNGIDRINNKKGYIKSNCVACCWLCNQMKKAMTQKQFYEHINKIAKTIQLPHNVAYIQE